MDQMHFKEARAAETIIGLYKSSRLIPFLGSGFTKQLMAKKGRVPDAADLVEIITETASSKNGISVEVSRQIREISKLKNAFNLLRQSEYFSENEARALLENIFSNVRMAGDGKAEMLRLDWPHIFTFNIDDAIERVLKSYRVLSPNNKQISREFIASNRCLFKIHGDISQYISTLDYNLIFTWRDYGHSIEKNKAMLEFLREEAKNSAFLFLGCSLDAEIDLLNVTYLSDFSKSIFLKRGRASVDDVLTLSDYGIDRIIYFDKYDEVAPWLVETLRDVVREKPFRELEFDDADLKKEEAIRIIASGGPLSKVENETRVVRTSGTFPTREEISTASRLLRANDCLLVTGRRFSGKSLFLYQLMEHLKEFGVTYFASSDSYSPMLDKLLQQREQHLFVFDSNCLDSKSLDKILNIKMHSSVKIVVCSSLGDAEEFRYKLEDKGVSFEEVEIKSVLNLQEASLFNESLSAAGLPIYQRPENLLTFAYRYYGEFEDGRKYSELFSRSFDKSSLAVLVLIAAFGKAQENHISSFNENFDVDGFVKNNDRIFEKLSEPGRADIAIVCNSLSWLLKKVGDFIEKDPGAISVVADIAVRLSEKGFSGAASSLIRFDKLNELGNGANARKFIRGVYSKISVAYKDDLHYWLQRAKSELIGAIALKEVEDGMGYARKVRLDVTDKRGPTYFSATLVLAQLYARAYKMRQTVINLIGFLDSCLESVRNYENNRRFIDKLIQRPGNDFNFTLRQLNVVSDIKLLERKKDVQELLTFFESRRSK